MALRLVHDDEFLRRVFRRKRVFRDQTNPLETYKDNQLLERYRFRWDDILWLTDEFGKALEFDKLRKGGLAPAMQIMVALRVFASAGFQIDVGDTFGISKATVCRTVHRVANVLAGAFHRYVKLERRADAEVTKAKFYAMAGFSNVIGCIDCTHIRISGPHQNEHEYVNRKGVHSINVQLVCNADLSIMNAEVKWPGESIPAKLSSKLKPKFVFCMRNHIYTG